jgi:hypothetical protein
MSVSNAALSQMNLARPLSVAAIGVIVPTRRIKLSLHPEFSKYAEGVASHSPGLRAERATLGRDDEWMSYPEAVASNQIGQ